MPSSCSPAVSARWMKVIVLITLMHSGAGQQRLPLVLVEKLGGTYWKTWDIHACEELLRNKLISPDDLSLYRITDSTEEAVKIIRRFYRNYQSSRFVRDLLVIRLKNAPNETAIAAMNEDFADIIIEGKIQNIKPTPEEVEHQEHLDLKRTFSISTAAIGGRLRQLIDVLNGL